MLRTAFVNVRLTRPTLERSFADANKSLYEKAKETVGKVTEKVIEPFKDDGVIGKQFQDTEEGTAARAAQKVADVTGAESLDKHGKIGKQFTKEGKIGGKVDEIAEKGAAKGEEMKVEAKKTAH